MVDIRPRLKPGPSHPITVTPYDGEVTARIGDTEIARSRHALVLEEASYPAVFYIPRADVDRSVLRDSDHHTYCPYKGEASYHDIETADRRLDNAVWYYPEPYDAVAPIADHLAFSPDRVDVSG